MKNLNIKEIDTFAEEIKTTIIDKLNNYMEKANIEETEKDIIENYEHSKEDQKNINDAEMFNNKNIDLEEIIKNLKTNKNVGKPWWHEYKRKFKSGDIVYISNIKKFGIFISPSSKEEKVKVRLIRNNNKNNIYTTDWVFNIDEIELVKHNNRINKKFSEDELMFKIKQ